MQNKQEVRLEFGVTFFRRAAASSGIRCWTTKNYSESLFPWEFLGVIKAESARTGEKGRQKESE